jgi:polysaccharide biosynthesis/export protein
MFNLRSGFRQKQPFALYRLCPDCPRTIRSLLLATAVLCPVVSAKAEYRLHPGDVIEISVARVPELKQRTPVQMDGNISYPLVGMLSVANLSLAEVQNRLQALLATKVFRQRMPDGRTSSVTIEADEVAAAIVEYRPVYVNGDVSKPGELAYRPGLTVRKAVALAGGYDLVRLRMNNPLLESADLQGEYESLWTEYAKEQAHIWRLKQELGQSPSLDEKALLEVPIPRSTAQSIVDNEVQALQSRETDIRAERTFLQHGIAQADEEIGILSEQQKTEDEGAKADVDDFARMQELYNRGTLPILRVTDARRAMLLSATRKLQTTAQLMQTRRQRDDLFRQIDRLEGQRRSDLLKELQEATVALGKIRIKLQSTGEKLRYTALAKSELAGGVGKKPAITIVRNDANGVKNLDANEEFELQPGDVAEVSLMLNQPSSD